MPIWSVLFVRFANISCGSARLRSRDQLHATSGDLTRFTRDIYCCQWMWITFPIETDPTVGLKMDGAIIAPWTAQEWLTVRRWQLFKKKVGTRDALDYCGHKAYVLCHRCKKARNRHKHQHQAQDRGLILFIALSRKKCPRESLMTLRIYYASREKMTENKKRPLYSDRESDTVTGISRYRSRSSSSCLFARVRHTPTHTDTHNATQHNTSTPSNHHCFDKRIESLKQNKQEIKSSKDRSDSIPRLNRWD